jgi:hypothetical protein
MVFSWRRCIPEGLAASVSSQCKGKAQRTPRPRVQQKGQQRMQAWEGLRLGPLGPTPASASEPAFKLSSAIPTYPSHPTRPERSSRLHTKKSSLSSIFSDCFLRNHDTPAYRYGCFPPSSTSTRTPSTSSVRAEEQGHNSHFSVPYVCTS